MTKKKISVRCGSTPKIIKDQYNKGNEFIGYTGGYASLSPEGSLDSILRHLHSLRKRYRDEYENLNFVEKHDCGCYSHDCGCSPTYALYGERYETDLEYNFRIAKEKKQAQETQARELHELNRLKEKYNG